MDKKLMKLFLECPDDFRDTVITDNQISLLRSIKDSVFPYVTTKTLSAMKGNSIQLASNTLARLYRKGYLARTERVAETGGIEYLYRCEIDFD